MMIWRTDSASSLTANLTRVNPHPMITVAARIVPTQYSHTARAPSHHVSAKVEKKLTRWERNGTVYTASKVHHTAVAQSRTGNSRNANFAAAAQPESE